MAEVTIKIDELLKNPVFITNVQLLLRDLIRKRLSRPIPPKGRRYKRDWYDRMNASGTVTSSFFLENIRDIWLKKSNLSSETRSVILHICNQAVQKTVEQLNRKNGITAIMP